MTHTHKELVDTATKWLWNFGCTVVFHELTTRAPEIPDAIGWKKGKSLLIECKTTRSDFLADKNKFFRQNPQQGMGNYRFYLCPPDVINVQDLPEGWGLLWATTRGVRRVRGPKRNTFYKIAQSGVKCHRVYNAENEKTLMLSALRRLHLRGHLEEIYNPKPVDK